MCLLLHFGPMAYYYTLSDVFDTDLDTDLNSGRLGVRTASGGSTGIRRHSFQTLSLKVFFSRSGLFRHSS
jgi:hypothetical protein